MKAYKALSKIQHGGPELDDNSVPIQHVFEFGEVVTGLDKETMRDLWDAGVLEEIDVPDAPSVHVDPTPGAAGSSPTVSE